MKIAGPLTWAVVVALVACSKEPASGGNTSSTCDGRVKAFDDALAESSAGSCAADGDCRCYPGGISAKHGCGGVSDAKTTATLESIAKGYHEAGCTSGIACAAWVCMASCEGGKCTNAPPAAKTEAKTDARTEAKNDGGGTCESRLAEFDRAVAGATKKCKTDKDCACYRAGVSRTHACGDITDAKTNEKLESIAKEWTAAGCKNEAVACPAVVCEPACNNGTCGPKMLIQ